MAKVEKVTAEEIARENEKLPKNSSASNASGFSADKNLASKTYYISKLPMAEIERFFKKFGANIILKLPNDKEPKFVYVSCNCFDVTFNDFEAEFNFDVASNGDETEKSSFDMEAFSKYLEKIGMYPDQAIQNMMWVELFGERFPSYATSKKNFDLNSQKQAFSELPKEMQRSLKSINELKENEASSLYNKSTYGNFNIEEYLKRTN